MKDHFPPLEYRLIGEPSPDHPTLVFLHEGLGSVSMWRDFPDRLAAQTGLPALVYSRFGYGQSACFESPLTLRFMHDAALQELPQLLSKLDIQCSILVGHSDGASIALIAAASRPAGLQAVLTMAPHLFVEPICQLAIRAVNESFEPSSKLAQSLSRHHRNGELTFRTWCDIWLKPEFAAWSIESLIPQIDCPVLAVQGEQDQYGTMAQIRRIEALHANTECVALADCKHSPHLEQSAKTLSLCASFIDSIVNSR